MKRLTKFERAAARDRVAAGPFDRRLAGPADMNSSRLKNHLKLLSPAAAGNFMLK